MDCEASMAALPPSHPRGQASEIAPDDPRADFARRRHPIFHAMLPSRVTTPDWWDRLRLDHARPLPVRRAAFDDVAVALKSIDADPQSWRVRLVRGSQDSQEDQIRSTWTERAR
jgi:hypothetical protein